MTNDRIAHRSLAASFAAVTLAAALLGCGREGPLPKVERQPTFATPGAPLPGAYRLQIRPRDGRMALVAVGERASALFAAYDYGGGASPWVTCADGDGDCLPPAGQVALYTDQSLVSYFDGTTCFGAGCTSLSDRPACQVAGTFCGPLQLTSNLAVPLHDVVVQLENAAGQPNWVSSCEPSGSALFSHGMCAEDPLTVDRVDSASSNLTSAITGCSLCVGNARAAADAGVLGLVHAVVPGQGQPAHDVQRVFAAITLGNSDNFDVLITVHPGRPAFDALDQLTETTNGAALGCITTGVSEIALAGGGFGAPGACTDQPLVSCPDSGLPGVGYEVRVEGGAASGTALDIVSWSAERIVARLPNGVPGAGQTLRVVTPAGEIVASEVLEDACACAELALACSGTPFGAACSDASGEGVCTCQGGVVSDQADLDALAPCHEIDGDLYIDGTVTDLAALANLRLITGDLTITGTSLASLAGLEHLTQVASVIIDDNDALTSLAGLGISGTIIDLFVTFNDSLASLAGLERLTSIIGTLQIQSNTSLATLAPLEIIDPVATLVIAGNSALADVGDVGVAGANYVFIGFNPDLTSLAGLALGGTVNHLEIRDNPLLGSLAGLGAVTTVNDVLAITNNDALTSLAALTVTGTVTYAVISENAVLTSLAGLGGLSGFGGLSIVGNPLLASIADLAPTSLGNLIIKTNPALTSVAGLEGVASFTLLSIENNAALTTLAALAGATSAQTVHVVDNVALVTLGLAGLVNVNVIEITGNSSLCDSLINAFDAVAGPGACAGTCTGNLGGC